MFSIEQINSLLDILKNQNLIFINSHLGPDYLTQDEIMRLQSFGINPYHHYSLQNDIIEMSFHFGIISDAIGTFDARKITHSNLVDYFKSGEFIPLTKIERNTIESIKRQFLGDVKSLQGRMFNDINNTISIEEKNNRQAYEKVIRDEVLKGVEKRKTAKNIARELARKTGDWNRNFDRIVQFISHTAFNEGRAAMLEEKSGKDALVWKDVYDGACRYCISAYCTGGIGSEPKIFKLSTLKANGTNIGRKVNELKPVIGSHHPHCRCTINELSEGYNWNKTTRNFDLPKENYKPTSKRERKPVRITINNKTYLA